MKAALLEAFDAPLVIRDIDIAAPGPNEVLVRTAAVGLCHSDLHMMQGLRQVPLPLVLGHEVAGVVEAVGPNVTGLKAGDHVVGCLSVFCGHCPVCVSGHQVLCANPEVKMAPGVAKRLSMNGAPVAQNYNLSGFAEQMLVHQNALVKVRDDMPLDLAALLGCGVLTGYGSVTRTAQIPAGSTVAVIGCGGVGLSAIHAAHLAGAARVIAIDIDPAKLEMAKLFGATDGVDGADPEMVKKVIAMTKGGVDYAFECIGIKKCTEDSFAMLRPRGTTTIVGMIPLGTKVEFHGFDFLHERRVQGSMMGSNNFTVDIPRLIEFHMQGRMQLEKLVSKRIRLEDVNEGFAAMERGGIARSVIVFD